MSKKEKIIEDILANGLAHILKRTIEVDYGDQLAIAQEYKEWINCVTANDFSKQEILILDKFDFKQRN